MTSRSGALALTDPGPGGAAATALRAERLRVVEAPGIAERIAAIDGPRMTADLDAHGAAVVKRLLTPAECRALAALYDGDCFRSRVVMTAHGFGRGESRYFAYPLPAMVTAMRASWYARLAPIANRWAAQLGRAIDYPDDHASFLARCHAGGQRRPTPMLLRHGEGDYDGLHQELDGVHAFPLRVTVLLSEPGRDFTGGSFVITDQRPRMQSRAQVVPLGQGDAVVFAAHDRPAHGADGTTRLSVRHGVSWVRTGQRHTLGLVFHDAG